MKKKQATCCYTTNAIGVDIMYRHRFLIKFALIIILLSIIAIIAFIIYSDHVKQDAKPLSAEEITDDRFASDMETKTTDMLTLEKKQKKIRQEFLDLRDKYSNDDIIGYIEIEGTSIDYPVVKYSDNEFYLERNIYAEQDKTGWIFMDYENNVDYFDRNTIIYGHNMKKDIMFHALRLYQNEEFFKEHRYIVFKTLYEDTVWEIFSFIKTHVSLNYLQVQPSDKEFMKLLDAIKAQSMYDTGVDVTLNDKILNLSTCSVNPSESMYRYVLSAKLIDNQSNED